MLQFFTSSIIDIGTVVSSCREKNFPSLKEGGLLESAHLELMIKHTKSISFVTSCQYISTTGIKHCSFFF